MIAFVDTSAFLAYLDPGERRHADVVAAWNRALADDWQLVTSNYVLVETLGLVQRRMGLEALRRVADVLVPLFSTLWVDEELHSAAVAALFIAGRRRLSLVDCSSFELMRRRGISTVLALDREFRSQGFDLLPA